MADMRSRALSALRDGRVRVCDAWPLPHDLTGPPATICAVVESSRGNGLRYVVDYLNDRWSCTCRDIAGCPHIAAVQLVTGHESAAAKGAA